MLTVRVTWIRIALGSAVVLASASSAARAADFPGFQADPAHTGYQAGESFVPPLSRVWSREMGGEVSYPVIAEGKVFVTVADREYSGTTLFALDAATGAPRWSKPLEHETQWSGLAYEGGRLFVLPETGGLYALDPATGAQQWRADVTPPEAGPPTAAGGSVYVSGQTTWYAPDEESSAAGGVYAIRASDGAVRWRRPVLYGNSSSPTVDDQRVYVGYNCSQIYAFARDTGETRWHYDGGCAGGGGDTTTLYAGTLWTLAPKDWQQGGIVFDASTGGALGRFAVSQVPAFADGVGYFVRSSGVSAVELSTGRRLWERPTGDAGPETFTTPPLVVGGVLYAGTYGGK